MENLEQLLLEYDADKDTYSHFKTHLIASLGTILYDNHIRCHEISGRLKTRGSLTGKIIKGKKSYSKLSEITDITGLRITTYFSKDVDRIAALLDQIFIVDMENTIDKRISIDPDRFGYVSLHYIIQLKPNTPYFKQEFRQLKAEIQIRSILQHAWAEIEHDLGYKNENAVPRKVKRKFARIASLLELADEEFDLLSEQINEYVTNLKDESNLSANNITIDLHSIQIFLQSNKILAELDDQIAKNLEVQVSGEFPIRKLLNMCALLNIDTIYSLSSLLKSEEESIAKFANEWFTSDYSGHVAAISRGTSVLFLFYSEISKGADFSKIISYLKKYGTSNSTIEDVTKKISSIRFNIA